MCFFATVTCSVFERIRLPSRLLAYTHTQLAGVTHPVRVKPHTETNTQWKQETTPSVGPSVPLAKLTAQTLSTLSISLGLNYQTLKRLSAFLRTGPGSLNLARAKKPAARKAEKSVCRCVLWPQSRTTRSLKSPLKCRVLAGSTRSKVMNSRAGPLSTRKHAIGRSAQNLA